VQHLYGRSQGIQLLLEATEGSAGQQGEQGTQAFSSSQEQMLGCATRIYGQALDLEADLRIDFRGLKGKGELRFLPDGRGSAVFHTLPKSLAAAQDKVAPAAVKSHPKGGLVPAALETARNSTKAMPAAAQAIARANPSMFSTRAPLNAAIRFARRRVPETPDSVAAAPDKGGAADEKLGSL
jgi:hypothetical protein